MVSRKDALVGVILVAVGVGSVTLFGSGGGDDSHITWWAVDELVRTGRFHNFNQVTLEQSSSLALVLIAALFRLLTHIPMPALGVALSIAALCGACWMAGRVAQRLAADLRLPATLLVATSAPLVYWGTSGMETALAAFASAWLLNAIGYCLEQPDKDLSQRRGLLRCSARVIPASALFAGVRPENLLLLIATLVGGFCLCGLLFIREQRAPTNARIRAALVLSGAALAPVVAMFAWRRVIFHEWFPHPVAAKGGGGARWSAGWNYLLHHTPDFQPAMFVLLPVSIGIVLAALWLGRVQLLSGFVAVLSAAGVIFICASGGDWMSCGRFLAPFVPAWWLTVLVALSIAWKRIRFGFSISVSVIALANLWFLVNLARSGGTNGYPLQAALQVVPAAKRAYSLESYPFIELANKSHLRDALLSEELKKVVAEVAREVPGKIWLASGQAGAVPYHVFSAFPGKLRFIDFWGLTTSEVIPCIPPSRLRHSALGVAASPELTFEYRDDIWRNCHVPTADIVFNTSLKSGTRKGLEARGYRVVYFQRGAMPNYAEPSFFHGGTSIDAYIAVKAELAEKLHLRYREVRWAMDRLK